MENIFLSYHFDDRIKSLVNQLSRLIISHDLTIMDGQRLSGQQLPNAVKENIKSSDALICILSQREGDKTSNWVQMERALAFAEGIPFIALVEEGVPNTGPFQDFEYIRFNMDNQLEVILKISETILLWKSRLGELLLAHLEPDEVVESVRQSFDSPDIVTYRFFSNKEGWGDWKRAIVKPNSGGVTLVVSGVTKDTEIQFQVRSNGRVWNSDVLNRNLRVLMS